jgi:putative transposase
VEKEKANYGVVTMCRVLGVSTSGFYAWRQRGVSARDRANERLLELIKDIHRDSRQTYGAPRIHAELTMGMGIRCSKNRVARLMQKAGIQGISRRRLRSTTKRNPAAPLAPDLVNRCFTADAPNRLWVADITQHPTEEGWLYLAVVLDAFSHRVVGWAMGPRITAELAVEAVNMAVWNRRPQNVIHHSDHGSQYTSVLLGKTLRAAGIKQSMGSIGDAYDNAMAESFFATLQTELLDRRKWPTRRSLATAIFEYIEVFYNRKRRQSSLGYLCPQHFEEQWLKTTREVDQLLSA